MERIAVRETGNYGKGLFAVTEISKDDLIFDWEGGPIFEAEKATDLPREVRDYAIQFEAYKWIDTEGLGRYANHSCSPNSGIRGLTQLVAIRDINIGEEILWDYDMTENSDWVMEVCRCNSERCRRLIHGYRFLPEDIKMQYIPFTSDWLKS